MTAATLCIHCAEQSVMLSSCRGQSTCLCTRRSRSYSPGVCAWPGPAWVYGRAATALLTISEAANSARLIG